jgi:hypothetical protein
MASKPASPPSISLAPGAENNAFATMLADLVRQNLESKPHKTKDFDALARGRGVTIALVADDAEVALTLEFRGGRLVLHDGIMGMPDVAVRGTADQIMALSNVPLTRPLALPIPTDRPALDVLVEMVRATRSGELKVLGMFGNLRVLSRLTRVMSVNG